MTAAQLFVTITGAVLAVAVNVWFFGPARHGTTRRARGGAHLHSAENARRLR